MRPAVAFALMISLCGIAAAQTSYYDWDGAAPAPRPVRAAEPESPKAKKVFIVDGGASSTAAPRALSGSQLHVDDQTNTGAGSGNHVALPPNMERGVRDLESGMDDLRVYTAEMAVHIQKNGLRGFLAVPPEIKQKGNSIGRHIGGGINGITTDVAKDMIVPEQH